MTTWSQVEKDTQGGWFHEDSEFAGAFMETVLGREELRPESLGPKAKGSQRPVCPAKFTYAAATPSHLSTPNTAGLGPV